MLEFEFDTAISDIKGNVTWVKLYKLLAKLPPQAGTPLSSMPSKIHDDGDRKVKLLALFFGAAPFQSSTVLQKLLVLFDKVGGSKEKVEPEGGEVVNPASEVDEDDDEGEGEGELATGAVAPTFADVYRQVLNATIDAAPAGTLAFATPEELVTCLSTKSRSQRKLCITSRGLQSLFKISTLALS